MLYLETDEDGDRVFLHADQVGIQRLRELLDTLEVKPDQPEHDHLFTQAWGGKGLDETLASGSRDRNSGSNRIVHELKAYYWPKLQADAKNGS